MCGINADTSTSTTWARGVKKDKTQDERLGTGLRGHVRRMLLRVDWLKRVWYKD